MKLLLSTDLDYRVLPLFIQIDYLKSKGIPFWIYDYNHKERLCVRKSETDTIKSLAPYTYFLSMTDLGDQYVMKDDKECHEKNIYRPYFQDVRFDKDLITLVESNPERYEDYMEVAEVQSGEKYRIATSYNSSNHEYIEHEKTISWNIAL